MDDDAKRTDECNAVKERRIRAFRPIAQHKHHTCFGRASSQFAFKRAAPFSYTDRTGWCYLLQVRTPQAPPRPIFQHAERPVCVSAEHGRVQGGGLWRRCAIAIARTHARVRVTDLCHRLAELFTRQVQSERQCSAIAPGLDSAPPPLPQTATAALPVDAPSRPSSPLWQTRCASACRRRARTRACSRTRTRRPRRTRCRTTGTRRRARADCRCRAASSRQ